MDVGAHSALVAAFARFLWKPRYLEVGVAGGDTFRQVKPFAREAVGIDIASVSQPGVLLGDSEEVMASLQPSFDLVFIDASHEKEKTRREIEAALRLLSDRGVILLHDTVPPTHADKGPKRCYNVHELLPELAADERLDVVTIRGQYGMTIVTRKADA